MITAARKRVQPKLSVSEAARRAGISESRWWQIVRGYQTVGGIDVPVNAPPETIARMAKAVGNLTSADLRAAGRIDAAEELQALEDEEKHGHKTNQELRIENAAIADEVAATLIRLGLDLNSRQERIMRRSVQRMLEDLTDGAGPKPPGEGREDEGHEAS